MSGPAYANLLAPDAAIFAEAPSMPVRMLLTNAVEALRWAGYGNVLDNAAVSL
jgi:hypothetical protein